MAQYQLKLNPAYHAPNTESSMDTAIVNGVSIQRTGYIDVYSTGDRKVVSLIDGELFNDTMEGLADIPGIIAI